MGTGQGYPGRPATPPQRPARRTKGGGYVLPHQSTPRGDAGHSVTPAQRVAINRTVRDVRLSVLRERERKAAQRLRAGGATGIALNLADNLAHALTSRVYIQGTGGGPTLATRASSLTSGRGISPGAATALAPPPIAASETILPNVLSDAISFPLLGPATIFDAGSAAVSAAQGNTAPAGRLLEGLTQGAIGLAAQGKFDELGKYVGEHPLFFLAEARGAKAAVGRGVGAAARAAPSRRVRQAASTARPDREIAPGITERRHYSPDVITKAGQVLYDRTTGNRATNPEGRLRSRADFISDAAHATNRIGRDEELRAAHRAQPTRARSRVGQAVERRLPSGRGAAKVLPGRFTRPERDIIPLLMQRVVRNADTLEGDLRKELGRLNTEYANRDQFRSGAQARANRQQAQAIARVLADPKALANAKRITGAADELVRRTNQLESRAQALEALDPDAAGRSKLFPYAQAHMDAKYSDAPFKASRAKEVKAGRELRTAKTEARGARVTYARKLTTAQRRVADARRTYLRSDETYAKLEAEHNKASAEVKRLRKEVQADENVRPQLEAASAHRRSLAGQLASRAKVLHDKPVVREIKAGPRQGKKRPTAKARVKRAERKVLALKAERDKKTTSRVAEAKGRYETAARERKAQQVGGRREFVTPDGKHKLSFPTLHDRDGKRLTNEQIVEHMRKAGVPFDGKNPLVAFLPHRPDTRGARAMYQTAFAGRRDITGGEHRTGEAFRKGTHDSSYNLATDHAVRLRGLIGRIEQHDQLVREQGKKRPDGRAFTWDEAEDFVKNWTHDSHGQRITGRVELVPYRIAPGRYNQEKLASILERQDPEMAPEFESVMERAFAARLEKPENTGTRNVVLIPKATADRLLDQMRPTSNEGRVGNVAASLFRTTVLPFSFKWLVGNAAEAALRLAAVGAGPNSHRIGKKVIAELRRIDTEESRRAEAALIGGLQFGQKGLTVTRKGDQFAGTPYEGAAKAIELAGQVPPIKLLVGSVKAYTHAVFSFNRWMEQHAQVAALGKWSRREMQEFTDSWGKATRAQGKAVEDVAKGLTDTKNVLDAARYLDETLGKYSRFSPKMRRFIQTMAPFLPWYMNAIRFVGWTLPAKHPIKTALLVRLEATIQDDFDAQHANLPPGELKAAIPTGDGGWVDIARYGPFGAWTGPLGGDVSGVADPFLPQFSAAYKALATGTNFAGRPIKAPPGDKRSQAQVRIQVALNSLMEGFLPLAQIGRRVREGGSTPYDTSTLLKPEVKPGTDTGSPADRILNPIRPVRLGAAPAKPQPAVKVTSSPEDVEFERMLRGVEQAAPEVSDEEFERMLRAAGG